MMAHHDTDCPEEIWGADALAFDQAHLWHPYASMKDNRSDD